MARHDPRHRGPEKGRDAECTYSSETGTVKMDRPCYQDAWGTVPKKILCGELELGPVLAHLFQQSLDKGEIPKKWSLANICQLYKKGDWALLSNYRPVSLTCVPCKMLEHIVCTNIMAHLDEHNMFFMQFSSPIFWEKKIRKISSFCRLMYFRRECQT